MQSELPGELQDNGILFLVVTEHESNVLVREKKKKLNENIFVKLFLSDLDEKMTSAS